MMNYKKINIDGANIFYRECGSAEKPAMILFHGFPSSSHMFRDLMPRLENCCDEIAGEIRNYF